MANKFRRVPPEIQVSELSPLQISCTSTKCEDGYHCFKTSERTAKKFGEYGVCKECGINLIDWERIHKNDLSDVQFIFSSLKRELIRHVFWHTPIDKTAIEKAQKLGNTNLRIHARKVLKSKIGKASNFREGYQTPKTGNEIVNYAQHATATCCRNCLEYWHNIPSGTELTDDQIEFCTELVMLYIDERVSEIN